jgi:hypothetical protein
MLTAAVRPGTSLGSFTIGMSISDAIKVLKVSGSVGQWSLDFPAMVPRWLEDFCLRRLSPHGCRPVD